MSLTLKKKKFQGGGGGLHFQDIDLNFVAKYFMADVTMKVIIILLGGGGAKFLPKIL